MMKIMLEKWDKHSDKLKEKLSVGCTFNTCSYVDLVRMTFETIFNSDDPNEKLDLDKITIADNGDYQGTKLFIIPFDCYQPSEFDYIMTYVGYGSCSGCDTLQAIQDWSETKLTDSQITEFMALCKDLVTNAIKPYNSGWRYSTEYDEVTM